MKPPFALTQKLSRPSALWLLYFFVLFTAGLGLAVLSQHALRLGRQQSEIAGREAVQQNVRVALWRLDSRLGPYLATIQDPSGGLLLPHPDSDSDYVRQRFALIRAPGEKGDTAWSYMPIVSDIDAVTAVNEGTDQLCQRVPIDALTPHVQELTGRAWSDNINELVQNYGVPANIPDLSTSREMDNRNMAVQQQVAWNNTFSPIVDVRRGLMGVRLIPLWIEKELIVLRAIQTPSGVNVEGAWLDWPELKSSLLRDIDDLLPRAELMPVPPKQEADPSSTLVALPATIIPNAMPSPGQSWSATHTALLLSWIAFLAAACIAAVALARLIVLSERRASFVSAVTHELRTPLTTFRLYSDLLARDMVRDPDDRREYLQTLRREADRLTHLVDNVLRYSRLQRNGKRPELESVCVSEWVERIRPRLAERLAGAGMELQVNLTGDGEWMTDPAAMEQVIFNLIDNAAKYARDSPTVEFRVVVSDDRVDLGVIDQGPGVPPDLRQTLFKPFSKSAERAAETAAGVGLGLALAKQTVAALSGKLEYQPAETGSGSRFAIQMPRGDRK